MDGHIHLSFTVSSAGQTGSDYIISLTFCPQFQSVLVMTDKGRNTKFDPVQINWRKKTPKPLSGLFKAHSRMLGLENSLEI